MFAGNLGEKLGNAKKKSVGFSIAAATLATLFAPSTSAQATTTTAPVPKHINGNLAKAIKPNLAQTKQTPTRVTYVVKSGDSVWRISRQFNISMSALMSANKIPASGLIHPGQRLVIPSAATTSAPTTTTSKTTTVKSAAPQQTVKTQPKPAATATAAKQTKITYTVKRGDTLGAIARTHKTTVAKIAADNRIANPSLIRVGQKLVITSAAAQSTSTSSKATATTSSTNSTQVTTERKQLVPNTFLTYTYDDKTVSAANDNKYALLAMTVPSRAEVQQMIIKTAKEMGVDPKLALAHAYVESGFDARAVSPANALSVMQVIPSSGVWAGNMVGRPLNLLNTQDNIVAGIAIIRWLQKNARSFEEGIAGYYQGLGGVQRNGMRPDTVTYVAKVKAAMARF